MEVLIQAIKFDATEKIQKIIPNNMTKVASIDYYYNTI